MPIPWLFQFAGLWARQFTDAQRLAAGQTFVRYVSLCAPGSDLQCNNAQAFVPTCSDPQTFFSAATGGARRQPLARCNAWAAAACASAGVWAVAPIPHFCHPVST